MLSDKYQASVGVLRRTLTGYARPSASPPLRDDARVQPGTDLFVVDHVGKSLAFQYHPLLGRRIGRVVECELRRRRAQQVESALTRRIRGRKRGISRALRRPSFRTLRDVEHAVEDCVCDFDHTRASRMASLRTARRRGSRRNER